MDPAKVEMVMIAPQMQSMVSDWRAGQMDAAERRELLIDALQKVETGTHPDPNNAVGDDGRALGPLQIHEPYWRDAIERNPELGGAYENVRDPAYARMIVHAYLGRYAPANATPEQMARIHNGGPKGAEKQATLPYWERVQREMK